MMEPVPGALLDGEDPTGNFGVHIRADPDPRADLMRPGQVLRSARFHGDDGDPAAVTAAAAAIVAGYSRQVGRDDLFGDVYVNGELGRFMFYTTVDVTDA